MKSINASIPFLGTARVAMILVVLMLSVFGPSSALAAGDRTPPTKPTKLARDVYVTLLCQPGLEPVHR
jgi:hypothetical protein